MAIGSKNSANTGAPNNRLSAAETRFPARLDSGLRKLLGSVLAPLLERGAPDPAWGAGLHALAAQGEIVFVLRGASLFDYLAVAHWTEKLGLPRVSYTNAVGLFGDENTPNLEAGAASRAEASDLARGGSLEAALDRGDAAALFLERPATAFEKLLESDDGLRERREGGSPSPRAKGRRRTGKEPLLRLLERQRISERPIFLVPQLVTWSARAESRDPGLVDALFGPRDFPGAVRATATFAAHFRDVVIRAGEPLDLQAFLATSPKAPDMEDQTALVRRLSYAMLRRLERERRAVTGPAQKSTERVREEVLRSPKLQALVEELAGSSKEQRAILLGRAGRLLRGLEARQDPNALAVMERVFEATVARMYDGFEIDEAGLARLVECSKDGTLVLLPSHKSHIDYILLTRILLRAKMPAPIIAAGDNLDFFPLGQILRTGGAFFIRRKFGSDRLYGAVVDAYMRRLLREGHSLEFFLEGGRSRTGKLLTPKLGLLSMVVDAALGLGPQSRKVWFCPISLGYERLPEESSIVHELRGGEKKKESAAGLVKSVDVVLGSYGRVSVQFGTPISLEDVADGAPLTDDAGGPSPKARRTLVKRLGHQVMHEIGRVTAVTPGALAATALLTHGGRGISAEDLVAYAGDLARVLSERNARFSPRLFVRDGRGATSESPLFRRAPTFDAAILDAAALFVKAGAVDAAQGDDAVETRGKPRSPLERVKDSVMGRQLQALQSWLRHPLGSATTGVPDKIVAHQTFFVRHDGRLPLELAKNLLIHFFLEDGIVAIAALSHGRELSYTDLERRARDLSRIFKYEFSFDAETPFEEIFARSVERMEARGELVRRGDAIALPASGTAELRSMGLYASLFLSFVEAYVVAARALRALRKGGLEPRELLKKALKVGEKLYVNGEISRKESLTKPPMENAFLAFESLGYMARREGKWVLEDGWNSDETTAIVEARLRTYLLSADALPRPFVPRD